MRPHEMARHQTQHQAEIELRLDAASFWFKGHFAVQPLLPGVTQLDWVMHYAISLLAPDFRFHSIQSVKFQQPLLPDNLVTLTLDWQEERQIVVFRYQRHDGETRSTASSGKIRLCR